ncbi:hypothetical protein DCE79_14835 [Lysinibacillus sp. 2017]|uniref:sensor domain-containing diguanylate cyclase n=1 Tax=unclassified Lysinibacillus TaxID=2636778 RepID=UPI000D527C64|nr:MULTISPECIES: diguanylate cyclase [unclassified Lysinibacillus]AWE08565.1 hypothetical protein DCE79_14835 [Lysinibacillus sp. 2017]TGN35655.1 diguanylate cyclase [Lysinibacillus sp. S2017]
MKKNTLKLFIVALVLFVLLAAIGNFSFIGDQYGQPIDEIDNSIQWEFFEKQLLEPKQAAKAYSTGEPISFPHKFKEHFPSIEMYGTYVAKVKLPSITDGENWAVYVPYQYGSYKLYVGNQLVAKNGVVGTTKQQQVPENAPRIGQIHNTDEEVYITLQLSNFYSLRGGFTKPLYIGQFSELVNQHDTSIIFHFFINGMIFVASIFSFLLGFFNNRNKKTILFALLSFIIALRSVFSRPFLYSITIFDVPWQVGVKIESACAILAASIAITFFALLFSSSLLKKWLWLVQAVLAIQLLLIIFTEPLVFQQTFIFTFVLFLLLLLYIFIKVSITDETFTLELAVHFVGSLVIFMAAIHDLIVVQKGINSSLLVQHSQAMYVMLVCFGVSWQYAQKQKEEQRLKAEILAINSSLDLKIKERTTQLEKANERLQQLATKDALTGIANRYSFDHQLEFYFKQALQTKKDLSLLLIDLDVFKHYNDYYGHIMGDALLQRVVEVIDKQLPQEAFFARYGGEEFAIIYPNAGEIQLKQLGETIVEAVAAQHFEHIQHPLGFATISVGGCVMNATAPFESKKQFVTVADERLYIAKNNGRNQFVN